MESEALNAQFCFNTSPLSLRSLLLYSLSLCERKLRKEKMEHELDLQNPLTVYPDFHYDDVPSLFTNESDHMPRLLSFDPSDLRFSIRLTALSLIAQAKFSYDLDPFLVYLSVNYVDRFLSKQEIRDKSQWIPHILFVASLSLAAKMTNSDSSLLLSVLQRDGGLKVEAHSVHRMEKIILAALQWRMRSITPFSFLQHFLSLLSDIHDSSFTQSLKTRASDIIFSVQHELKLLRYKPSTVAASALLCAVEDLNPLTFSSSKIIIASCENINKGALLECVGDMAAITEASSSALMSCTATPNSVLELDRQRTRSISSEEEEGALTVTVSVSSGSTETNSVKRRRLLQDGVCDNRTFQISQIQRC